MKLKTLKNLIDEDYLVKCKDSMAVNQVVSDLRQEAINWIKELRRIREQLSEDNRFEIGWNEGRQQFIEEFFDITEEELK